MSLRIYHSDQCNLHHTGSHPEKPERLDSVHAALKASEALSDAKWMPPRAATKDELALIHTREHIDAIETMANHGGGMADPDTVVSPNSFDAAQIAAGALLCAVDAALDGESRRAFCAIRPPGHHATPDTAMGFCLFNNIAIAARYAQQKDSISKVFILDWDVHHGNGTQDAFYSDDSVYFCSTHQYPHYPGTGAASETGSGAGEGFTKNLPFPPDTPPQAIVEAVCLSVEKICSTFRPDLILISAGFDGHKNDPLGGWLLEEAHYQAMTECVIQCAKSLGGKPVISCLEGGYNLKSLASSCAAHCETLAAGA